MPTRFYGRLDRSRSAKPLRSMRPRRFIPAGTLAAFFFRARPKKPEENYGRASLDNHEIFLGRDAASKPSCAKPSRTRLAGSAPMGRLQVLASPSGIDIAGGCV
jgi:hypothetical protein